MGISDGIDAGAVDFYLVDYLSIVDHTLEDIAARAYCHQFDFIHKMHLFDKAGDIERISKLELAQTPDRTISIIATGYKLIDIIRIDLQIMYFFEMESE